MLIVLIEAAALYPCVARYSVDEDGIPLTTSGTKNCSGQNCAPQGMKGSRMNSLISECLNHKCAFLPYGFKISSRTVETIVPGLIFRQEARALEVATESGVGALSDNEEYDHKPPSLLPLFFATRSHPIPTIIGTACRHIIMIY
jgi:hypothetical protein